MMSLTIYSSTNLGFSYPLLYLYMACVVGVSAYYSTPDNYDDTIRFYNGPVSPNPMYECLEDRTPVSPNPMYEAVDVPNRNAYEEVPDFETKAVPNGIADVALYSYVPSTVSSLLPNIYTKHVSTILFSRHK